MQFFKNEMTSEKPRVAVVGLNMQYNDANLKDFLKSKAEKQIDDVCEHILQICQELESKSPPFDNWIVTWPENGITDRLSKFITNDSRIYLKTSLKKVADNFPKLTIIAGSVSTIKWYKEKNLNEEEKAALHVKLERIKKYYKEALNLNEFNPDFLNDVETYLTKIPEDGIGIVRNTSYKISHNGFESHDKISPYYEELMPYIDFPFEEDEQLYEDEQINDDTQINMNQIVFQPGNRKSNPLIFTVASNSKNLEFKVGIENCLENYKGVLRKFCEKNNINKPPLHLFISNSTEGDSKNIYGEKFIHYDINGKKYNPYLVSSIPENSDATDSTLDVIAFESNFPDCYAKNDKCKLRELPRCTILHVVCGDIKAGAKIVEDLIQQGFDVNSTCSDTGDSSLHIAAKANNSGALKLLLKSKADINQHNKKGETPLDCARPSAEFILKENGALPNLKINNFWYE